MLTGLVPYTELNVPDPIAKGVDAIGLGLVLGCSIKIGALAGLTTVILVLLYGQSRIFFTMSQDGLLPPVFARGASESRHALPQPDPDRRRAWRIVAALRRSTCSARW